MARYYFGKGSVAAVLKQVVLVMLFPGTFRLAKQGSRSQGFRNLSVNLQWSKLLLFVVALLTSEAYAEGVYVRFKLLEPVDSTYYIRLGGYIHKPNWYLPRSVVPKQSDKDAAKRLKSGVATEWFDLKAHCGSTLHGRLNRSGGVAEFPNVTAQVVTEPPSDKVRLVIELATAPHDRSVVKQFDETFHGDLTSFLVSPNLKDDAEDLETAAQMTARRLRWATDASGGVRVSPKNHIIQTSFWGPQRSELNLQEAKTLWLLGFNVVGNQRPEVREAYAEVLRVPGHTHRVHFGPAATQQEIDTLMQQHASKQKIQLETGVPFGLADEIAARPRIGENPKALAHFHAWLAKQGIPAKELGASQHTEVLPLETPDQFHEAGKRNLAAARRIFYYTSRFRQHAGTQRIRWHTEAFHKHFPNGPVTSTLVADHPYFGGTGLGMGFYQPDNTWGSHALALDWFDLSRNRAVDLIGIEDWMGLQYMYGPNSTWEGFQLMGFQASMMRSGGQGGTPIIAWITPSDETNLRLKSFSALAQGAKHFFFWTYGPTATSTENYWSDLRGSYDGVVRVTQQLAAAEHLIHPGKLRKTRVALLYSISSDLWQPYNYRHMLERRGTYLSLIHDQFLVDMLTEEDIAAGRLKDYQVLYATDPNISTEATSRIAAWVQRGGQLYGSCDAGSRNEFDEPVDGLAEVFGMSPQPKVTVQPGNYRTRGRLNDIKYLDAIQFKPDESRKLSEFGVIGLRVEAKPDAGKVVGTFQDNSPAVISNRYGKGTTLYAATTPGISYIKDANFVPRELAEEWPVAQRRFINQLAHQSGANPAVMLSHPVVEAGVYEASKGLAVVLANFSYQTISSLEVTLPVKRSIHSVKLASSKTPIEFKVIPAPSRFESDGFSKAIQFTVKLGLDEIVLVQ